MFYTFFSLIFLSSTSCRAGLLVIITIVLHPVVCLFICTVHCKRKTENSGTQIEIENGKQKTLVLKLRYRERKTENYGTQMAQEEAKPAHLEDMRSDT